MIPVQIHPISPNAPSALPNIGNLSNISGNAPQVPPAISSLPPGTLLHGFVLNRDANGQATLRSEYGDFKLQSSAFLKIGSELTIRIQASGTHFRADIIEIDGKPASHDQANSKQGAHTQADAKHATSNQASNLSARQDTIQRSGLQPPVDNQGNVQGNYSLNAVLLNPNLNAAKLQLMQGNALILQLLNLKLPSATTTNQPPSSPAPTNAPSTTSSTTAPSTSATTASPQPTSGNAPPISRVAQGYQQYQPTSQVATPSTPIPTAVGTQAPLTTNTQALPQHVHTLTVIGHESDGDPVVQTPFGLSKLTSGIRLPVGATLQAQIALNPNSPNNPLVATQTAAAGGPAPTSLFKLASDWPALQQIVQLLGAAGSGVGGAGVGAVDDGTGTIPITALPQLAATAAGANTIQPAQFASGFFLFFTALQGRSFQSFLGESNIQKLTQAGHSNLLNQASADFAQLARLTGDHPGQWQTMFFPVLVGGEIEMVRWFTKRDQSSNKEEQEKKVTSTRFVVELNTSVLGELQLDGLYHYESERNKLELVLRSHSPLDDEIRHAIMQIVQEVNDTTGVFGSITFQNLANFPEHPLEEAIKDIPDVIA